MIVKKMIYLDAKQERILKRLAAQEAASETEVVRRALDLYAREHSRDPLADLIGKLKGGPPDLAAEHDRYILAGPNEKQPSHRHKRVHRARKI